MASWFEQISWILGGLGALIAWIQSRNAHRQALKAERKTNQARKDLQNAVTTLETQAQPTSLDEELGEVSAALSTNVARLHNISERAKAFEDDVRALVEKAEIAKAAAALHEDDARKIAILLGTESQARLKEEIDRLSEAYAQQIEALKKSGSRTAWVTFAGGAIAGFGINVLTNWMMS